MPNKKSYRLSPPVHPGVILQSEFLEPMQLSQNGLARAISVPPRRINDIVHGRRAITADTALRLARHFGTSAQFWMNLQAQFELEVAHDLLRGRLEKEVRPRAA
jgi:addiction module HigA family antidote